MFMVFWHAANWRGRIFQSNDSGLLLRDLVAVCLEFFAEGFELATARWICVALSARQSGLRGKFRLCVRRRCADDGGRRTYQ